MSCVNTKQILVTIKNNTDSERPIEVLQNAYLNSFFNTSTQYKYNITAQDYSHVDSVSIQVKTTGSDYETYTALLPTNDPSGVVAALNTMGIGTFYEDEDSGQIYIITDNDQFIYGDLDIFNAHPVTTFWNIYPSDTFVGQEMGGSTLLVYETDYRMTNAPADLQNYTSGYVWIVNRDTNITIYGSETVPYASAPNWSSFPGDPGAAIVSWLTTIFTLLTGSAPADYMDVFNTVDLTYAIDKMPSGTWGAPSVGRPSVEAAGSYNYGLLNFPIDPDGTFYETRIKFSKTQ